MIYHCLACGYSTDHPRSDGLGKVCGNTLRFNKQEFHLWRCDSCGSLIALDEVDFDDIYKDYSLAQNNPILKYLLRALIKRFENKMLNKDDCILDYGCNEGALIDLLKERGFQNVSGYDPYNSRFDSWPTKKFDWIISSHVIEHEADPAEHLKKCVQLLKAKGKILLDTPTADNIETFETKYSGLLHQPFHRVILSRKGMEELASKSKLKVTDLRDGIFNTKIPFMNASYMGKFGQTFEGRLDRFADLSVKQILIAYLKDPLLLFYGLFGYWFPHIKYRKLVESSYYLLERAD